MNQGIIRKLLLIIFLIVLLVINIPSIEEDQHIKMKIYLFVGIILFEFIISVIIDVYYQNIINLSRIIRHSVVTGLLVIVTYSSFYEYNQENPVNKIYLYLCLSLAVITSYFLNNLMEESTPAIDKYLDKLRS